METPWARATKSRSQKQEERLAKREDGSKQINSGRFWHSKGDTQMKNPILGRLLVEAKTTETQSYRIDLDDWAKINHEALRTPPGCRPVMNIEIRELRLMVFEETLFDEILKYIVHLEERLENG